jgi:MoxR-like ATPase
MIAHRTLLLGPQGVGKTALVRAAYDHVERLILSAMSPESLGGYPSPAADGSLEFLPPPWYTRLCSATGTRALFLDELDKAARETADTVLSLVDYGFLPSGHQLPAGIAVIAAANPPEWGGGDGISPAMLRRWCVRDVIPDVALWAEWAKAQSSPLLHAVAAAVVAGRMPLYDHAGEGMAMRITSPASIVDCVAMIDARGPQGRDELTSIAVGWLTAAAASTVCELACSQPEAPRQARIRRAAAAAVQRSPLRGGES